MAATVASAKCRLVWKVRVEGIEDIVTRERSRDDDDSIREAIVQMRIRHKNMNERGDEAISVGKTKLTSASRHRRGRSQPSSSMSFKYILSASGINPLGRTL
jgi:hypothetical protein